MILPCRHEPGVVQQVKPTADLLSNMDRLHPDVLQGHGIQPGDYHAGLVFRSAVESIRGSFIASAMTGRQDLAGQLLEELKHAGRVASYRKTGTGQRHDFEVAVRADPDYFAALEVKGGEGNSVNISERPIWAREFVVWCHLDGAIGNEPSHGAHSIVNRVTNELVRRGKVVDVVLFKDVLCGTRSRPCPKYPGREEDIGLLGAPDIFLFPRLVPSTDEPSPPVHSLDSLALPKLVLDTFGVEQDDYAKHVWEVRVTVVDLPDGRLRRIVDVLHEGEVVDSSKSRPWRNRR